MVLRGIKHHSGLWGQIFKAELLLLWDFPGGSDGKASAYNAGDAGSTPGSGRAPGEGNGTPPKDQSLLHVLLGSVSKFLYVSNCFVFLTV